MEIIIRLKNNYGQQVAYPACNKSKLFAQLADTKTLTKQTINIVKALGYEVRIEQQSSEEALEGLA